MGNIAFRIDAAKWAEIKAEQQRRYSDIRKRYKGIDLTDGDLRKIDSAERADAPCAQCNGLPCKKSIGKGCRNIINYVPGYGIEHRVCTCKFESNRQKQARIARQFRQSKIPAQYLGKTFADYVVDRNNINAVDIAKYLLETPTAGAYFFGSFGTGKTFLAAIIAQEIIKRGDSVLFASVPEISAAIRSTFNRKARQAQMMSEQDLYDNSPQEDEIFDTLYNVHTLILDDVGTEKPTKFVCEVIGKVINNRYNSQKQTIITSNYDLETIQRIYNNPVQSEPTLDGSRIYDRCKQMCSPVRLCGNSRRLSR